MHGTDHPPTRRGLMIATAASIAAPGEARSEVSVRAASAGRDNEPGPMKVSFQVNGRPCSLDLDPRTTLLDALREHLHLTGSKKGCDHGQC